MIQYLYAFSVVSHAGSAVNNGLYSGLLDRSTMIAAIRNIAMSYDPNFMGSVAIITCNVAEHHGTGRQFQFRRTYTAGYLPNCLEEMIGDLESAL